MVSDDATAFFLSEMNIRQMNKGNWHTNPQLAENLDRDAMSRIINSLLDCWPAERVCSRFSSFSSLRRRPFGRAANDPPSYLIPCVGMPCANIRYIFAYTEYMFSGPSARIHPFIVACKGCRQNIPTPVETMLDAWIVAERPLCGAKRRCLPADIFMGRIAHELRMRPGVRPNGGESWAR